MNLVTAHGKFAARPDGGASVLPPDIDVQTLRNFDPSPALATAACSLSGMLDDCETDGDLDEAAGHFAMLMSGEIISPDDWSREAERVICEVLRWGDCLEIGP